MDSRKPKILLTGVTGITGSYFLERLIREPLEAEYRCVVRENSNTLLLDQIPLEVEKVVGDLQDINFLCNACKGIQTVLHIANIRYSINIVQAALKNSVDHVILVHTTGVFSKYKSASKLYLEIEDEIHRLVNDTSLKITIIRPSMIYGSMKDPNISKFIKMVDKLPLCPVINGGHYPIQPVHQKDVADAYYEILSHPEITAGKEYIISGAEPIDFIEMFHMIASDLGEKRHFISVPFGFAYFASCALYVLSIKRIDFREKVQRLVEPRAYSHELATSDFGYNPIGFEEGLKIEIDEYIKSKLAR